MNNNDTVTIVFSEDKFYNDLDKPMFEKGIHYEIDNNPAWIQRWLNRGGMLVEVAPQKETTKVSAKEQAAAKKAADKLAKEEEEFALLEAQEKEAAEKAAQEKEAAEDLL